MIHGLITIAWCVLCAVVKLPWPFCFWAVAFYVGREVAQAEYRYIERHGGRRSLCPWWCGFIPEAWDLKSLSDWFCPLVAALTFTACSFFL